MHPGIQARLDRIGTDGRIVNVPMDHGISIGATEGLRDIEATIDAVTRGGADCVLTQKGLAPRVHGNRNGAGYVVHVNGSTAIGPDSNDKRLTGTAVEAVRAGADAVSFHINVGSDHEPNQIEDLAALTREAHDLGLPVLAMTYARGPGIDEHDAESLAHAVRIGEELGADLMKTAFSRDDRFGEVTGATGKPVIVAGGSPRDDRTMLQQVRDAMDMGADGVSMGRSVFQHDDPETITRAVAGIVHDDLGVDAAAERAELPL
jgi:fructose-bisphosphate aldolase/2-amino-3,7-dideoxy-D-threo-hept-6-ulosonate synthase